MDSFCTSMGFSSCKHPAPHLYRIGELLVSQQNSQCKILKPISIKPIQIKSDIDNLTATDLLDCGISLMMQIKHISLTLSKQNYLLSKPLKVSYAVNSEEIICFKAKLTTVTVFYLVYL